MFYFFYFDFFCAAALKHDPIYIFKITSDHFVNLAKYLWTYFIGARILKSVSRLPVRLLSTRNRFINKQLRLANAAVLLLQIFYANAKCWTDTDKHESQQHWTHFRLWNETNNEKKSEFHRLRAAVQTIFNTMNGTVHLLFYNLKRQQQTNRNSARWIQKMRMGEENLEKSVGSKFRHQNNTRATSIREQLLRLIVVLFSSDWWYSQWMLKSRVKRAFLYAMHGSKNGLSLWGAQQWFAELASFKLIDIN